MRAIEMAAAERRELGELLANLSDDEWHGPTLCPGWTVRDVVAHLVGYLDRSQWSYPGAMLRQRFSLHGLNADDVAAATGIGSESLLAQVRLGTPPNGVGAVLGGRITLVECMIHREDIAAPLGIERSVPPERLCVSLDFVRIAPLIRGAWTTRGVRLVATDLDWSAGRGPEVRGPAMSLLLAMARRPHALTTLSGPGVARLDRRLA
ncbi:maleylpyruvate isomerase family mycothiol-dependent enzyme [Gordonia sp. PKS22-38]|uniref:Maleylpyruvate isomerase family mycothiol-dependent enzyme n=1 Tax=Gordonia prachuapensis TaxID=3115651 RepID=A0ABU7MQ85_9ACTN|nr:maleylpyruvate isomerase family mycothiol-dependent enzyme [Gordonia sp. PKS22-38]